MKHRFLFFACWWAYLGAGAQPLDSLLNAQLQHTLDSVRAATGVKGISAAVLAAGQGRWNGTSGVSYDTVPIRSGMLFGIGSNTKTFTAALLLRMQEMGALSLDDAIGKWLPPHPYIDSTITVRRLLNHTSGLDDYARSPAYKDSILCCPDRIWQPQELLQFIGPPHFAPGQGWEYCNTNYLLAGMIAEAAAGRSIDSLFRQYLLNPLTLDSTFLAVAEPMHGEIAHRWVHGQDEHSIPINARFSGAWTAGGMFSTAPEMVQWMSALMGGQVLNAASLQQMLTVVPASQYGLGIKQAVLADRTVWMHGGNIRGYSSVVLYDTIGRASLAVLVNQATSQTKDIAAALLEVLARSSVLSSLRKKEGAAGPEIARVKSHPNPFSRHVAIRYMLPVAGRVELVVYDMTGRRIRTLVNRPRRAGWHVAIWDGRDKNGQPAPAGAYLCRLTSTSGVAMHRMQRAR